MKKIVLADQIVKKEKITRKNLGVIVKVIRKGIFKKIKGQNLPKDSSLIKVYATTVEGARRIVFLLDCEIDVVYFLFFRKKDDPIGKNISINNKFFKESLVKYLKILDQDIEDDNFEVVNIN